MTPELSSHIRGEINIDLKTGVFACRLFLSNLPGISNYKILLNKGMNIKYFKDAVGELIDYDGYYSGTAHHVGIEYHFIDDKKEVITKLPQAFYVEYVGAFPIYENEYNTFDFKGFIANNGKTLRATEQAKWYPVLYDTINDRYIDSYSYDLTIHAQNCSAIFINGSAPQKGEINTFQSLKPVPLFLFAGNFDFMSIGEDYLINTHINKETAISILGEMERIKSIYAKDLGIEFEDSIYIINHEAVEEIPSHTHWGFNVYPAFGFAGIDFEKILTDEGKLSCKYVDLFGHELAHNYFLNNVMSGKIFWFWLESCAEYLSFNVTEISCGKDYLKQKLKGFLEKINDRTFIPLGKIEMPQQIDHPYRYVLGPLILKCFELEFSKSTTYNILKSLLEISYTSILTIDEWEKASIKHGIQKEQFAKFRNDFLADDSFKAQVIDKISQYCA